MPVKKRNDKNFGNARHLQEKAILGQIAKILAKENFINPDEQIRFLELLKKED